MITIIAQVKSWNMHILAPITFDNLLILTIRYYFTNLQPWIILYFIQVWFFVSFLIYHILQIYFSIIVHYFLMYKPLIIKKFVCNDVKIPNSIFKFNWIIKGLEVKILTINDHVVKK
jgi:hypothetical protein